MTDDTAATPWQPKLTVTYDETGIALWIQPVPDGPTVPMTLREGDAVALRDGLIRAITDYGRLRDDLGELGDATPDDFQ